MDVTIKDRLDGRPPRQIFKNADGTPQQQVTYGKRRVGYLVDGVLTFSVVCGKQVQEDVKAALAAQGVEVSKSAAPSELLAQEVFTGEPE